MILQATQIEFITANTLLTTSSAILAVVVISNTVFHVSGWKSRWFSLIISLIVSATIYKLGIKDKPQEEINFLVKLLLISINGCLIYTSAFGLQNNIISQGGNPQVPSSAIPSLANPITTKKITFFGKW